MAMTILEKDYLNISQKLLDRARADKIERTAVKLVVKKKGAILMLKRAKGESFPDLYELPGGGLNEDEDIFSAGRREFYEETGLSIREFLSEPEVIDFCTISSNENCRGYILYILPEGEDIVLNSAEHSEYKWVFLSELDSLFMFPEVKELVKKILLSD